jgi:hypothetical protein
LSEDETTYKFFSSLVGEHGQELQWQPRVEHLPKGQDHATLDLVL